MIPLLLLLWKEGGQANTVTEPNLHSLQVEWHTRFDELRGKVTGLQEELQATTKRHVEMMSVHTEDIAALRREVDDLKRRPSQETGKPVVPRRRLSNCGWIGTLKYDGTLNEVSDSCDFRVPSGGGFAESTVSLTSGQTLKIKTADSVVVAVTLDRKASAQSRGRHFAMAAGAVLVLTKLILTGGLLVSTSLRRLCVLFRKFASDLDGFGGCAVATTVCEYESAQVVCDVLERCL